MSDTEGGASAKRPRTNEHDAGGEHLARIHELTVRNDELAARNEELAARNDELAAKNEELTVRNDELESENRVLRGEGKHGDSLLPVVIKRATASVDLSRVDPSLVAQVASFVGLSRDLLSMALTCKAFGWMRPSSTLGSSLIEEAARQFLVNQLRPSDIERNALPQYGNDIIVWIPILYELERLRLPLRFSKLVGCGLEYFGSESIVTSSDSSYRGIISTALTDYVMKRGVHYATFKLSNTGVAILGVVRPLRDFGFVDEEEGFDLYDDKHFEAILAQRTDAWIGNMHCCHIASNGEVYWTDLQEYNDEEGFGAFDEGDVIGLLVDLNEGTLTVYKNGDRLGGWEWRRMVWPGSTASFRHCMMVVSA